MMNTIFRHLGKYELHECLSRSKTSEVWKSYDPQLQRTVVIKMIIASTRDDPNFALHFTHEIETVMALRHPNIARIYEAQLLPTQNVDTALIYLVMDYIEGRPLAEYIPGIPRSGKFLPGADIVHCFASLSKALDYAHKQGIIHGNIKPTNIILDRSFSSADRSFEPILIDFCLLKILGNNASVLSNQPLASMFYISPEQARGYPANKQSDIYALGVILYEICTGVLPFQGTRPVALLTQHANTIPRSPSLINPNVSSALANVIMRCLEKEPAERFTTASSMTVALAKALNIPVPKSLASLPEENIPEEPTEHIRTNQQFQSAPDLGSGQERWFYVLSEWNSR